MSAAYFADPDTTGIPCSIFRQSSSLPCGRTSAKSTTPAPDDDGIMTGTRVGGDCSAPRSTDAATGSKRAEGATFSLKGQE